MCRHNVRHPARHRLRHSHRWLLTAVRRPFELQLANRDILGLVLRLDTPVLSRPDARLPVPATMGAALADVGHVRLDLDVARRHLPNWQLLLEHTARLRLGEAAQC